MKTTPETIAETCLAAHVRLLDRVITKMYEDALRPTGLTVSQLGILVQACQANRIEMAKVEASLLADSSTLSRNVALMRRAGLVLVVRRGRSKFISVTGKGLELLKRAIPAWEDAQRQTVSELGAAGVTALTVAIKSLQKTAQLKRAMKRAGAEPERTKKPAD